MMVHKSGFVNIIGNPNVGKSTLMNALVGEKLSIITPKAQTTRHRILGIVNHDDYQIVLSDTPGILKPAYELQSSMMDFVKSALDDADILIYMVEVGEKELKNEGFFNKIINSSIPVILLLNKIDTSTQEEVEEKVAYWKAKVPNALVFVISAFFYRADYPRSAEAIKLDRDLRTPVEEDSAEVDPAAMQVYGMVGNVCFVLAVVLLGCTFLPATEVAPASINTIGAVILVVLGWWLRRIAKVTE